MNYRNDLLNDRVYGAKYVMAKHRNIYKTKYSAIFTYCHHLGRTVKSVLYFLKVPKIKIGKIGMNIFFKKLCA